MDNFSYYCNTRIEMGAGKIDQLPELLKPLQIGRSILVVSDPGVVRVGLVQPILDKLREAGYRVELFDAVSPNPRDTECLAGAKLFVEQRMEAVVAIGGGSAMDTGKAIALLGPNGGVPLDYIEGTLSYTNIAPIVCVPTTAGTGAEVTRSSVITESSTHRKLTLKHAALRPLLAVLDPRLTFTVPKSVTAATGVDALVHAMEGYSCKVTNPISQALGARAMGTIASALPAVFRDGHDEKARFALLESSLLAGLCFGSSDVAAVHCLAEALGGLYDTPHGVANSVFLPYVLQFNALTETAIHAEMARHMRFADASDSDEQATAKLIRGVKELTCGLEIPKLRELPGVQREDFEKIAELAYCNNSTPSNVRAIGRDDYLEIIEQAFEDQ
ncbi:iron-containing alcohol dehydrogenase [Paenibacillus koleovorans]|uniref:iron-containing alcohol dehydrogenase n=1 Tax=Paenibacillus koleovorans TaxID=121608 RepID=UPI000FD9F901|nr:iron-containing alcohol dehydrogenase [Paenibacillus koleovorans]